MAMTIGAFRIWSGKYSQAGKEKGKTISVSINGTKLPSHLTVPMLEDFFKIELQKLVKSVLLGKAGAVPK